MAIRQNRRVPMDLYINKVVNGVPHLAVVQNISRDGLYLRRILEPQTPPGAHLAVEFMLPNSEELIWTEAELVHERGEAGQGLHFIDLAPRFARSIEQFIESELNAAG